MRIALYLVTYNNAPALELNLQSLMASDFLEYEVEINIINNHSRFALPPECEDKVYVYHNALRPDFSTGHLSRNWNQAFLNGFQSLTKPACDILVLTQDDVVFERDWTRKLIDLHATYSFIQLGVGDMVMSFLPEAVRRIGMWDERFMGIGYQDGDYFLRALIYNRDGSTINDVGHLRVHNPVPESLTLCRRFSDDRCVGNPGAALSAGYHNVNRQVFVQKWPGIMASNWTPELIAAPPEKPAVPTWLTYPYFEKDIPDLAAKGYLCDFDDPVYFF